MPGPRTHGPRGEPQPRPIATVVDETFTRFDTNDDAAITPAEVLAVLDPEGRHTELEARIEEDVAAIDGNDDGALSEAEVTAAVTAADTNGDGSIGRDDRTADSTADDAIGFLLGRGGRGGDRPGGDPGRGGARPEPTPVTLAAASEAIFTHFDSDASDTLNLSELLAGLDGRGRGGRRAELADKLLDALDSDADGFISATELDTALAAMDTDGDGSISAADHLSGDHGDVMLVGVLLRSADLDG